MDYCSRLLKVALSTVKLPATDWQLGQSGEIEDTTQWKLYVHWVTVCCVTFFVPGDWKTGSAVSIGEFVCMKGGRVLYTSMWCNVQWC